jgi:segregation and condensation protein B
MPEDEGGAVVGAEVAGPAPVETDEEAFLDAARDDEDPEAAGEEPAVPEGDAASDLEEGGEESSAEAMTSADTAADEQDAVVLAGKVEAILFSTEFPLSAKRLAQITRSDKRSILEAIDGLNVFYGETGRAFRIVDLAGGFQLVTTADHADLLVKLHKEKVPTRLSRAALETLSIIAFKQPATRAEIDTIRGVSASDRVLRHLIERKLVKIAGRAEAPGRPLLYGTTREFLAYFGLSSVRDLPRTDELASLLAGETPSPASLDEEIQEALVEELGPEALEELPADGEASRDRPGEGMMEDDGSAPPPAELQSHSGEESDEDEGDPASQ